MAIKRYWAHRDTTITDAYKPDLTTRGTGSNMGAADVLEVFNIFAQESSSSMELSRVLIQFSTNDISTDRTATDIPASGSVDFYLRLYNAKHSKTLPKNYNLTITAVNTEWEEGYGLDMEEYSDLTHDASGANWENAAEGVKWTTAGGDYADTDNATYSYKINDGPEDIELDITQLVEEWIDGARSNFGVGIHLTSSAESGSISYYTKKFFSRTSEFFFKRPVIEARWDSTKRDQRNNFFYSSSLAPAADNLNTLYLYNYVRGQLRDIPNVGTTGEIYIDLYAADSPSPVDRLDLSSGGTVPNLASPATGGWVATGIYSASMAITAASTPYTKLYDVWYDSSNTLHTGTIAPKSLVAHVTNPSPIHVTNITNLKDTYSTRETAARFRVFTRQKDWSPTIYTVASKAIENSTIENAYYKIFRVVDNIEVVKFATGSDNTPQTVGNNESYSRLSYDVSGNYFDYNMSTLESGFSYGVKFVYYINGSFKQQPEVFKFRVE